MAIRAVIYEKSTGEIKPNCHLCAVYIFDSVESMQYHIFQANIPNRAVAELTEEEFNTIQNDIDRDANQHKYKIDIKKVKSYLNGRKKEKYTIKTYGISYHDTKPERVIIPK